MKTRNACSSASDRGPRVPLERPIASASARPLLRRVCAAALTLSIACVSMVACAAPATYNPHGLGPAEVARVGDICRNVMGLDPSEPLAWGMHTGVNDLDTWTSHYRGCVQSLSSSLRNVEVARAASRAEQACRAKGLESGSPDLAVCVLESSATEPNPAVTRSATPAPRSSAPLPTARSFYHASNREISRRERLACAELGLEPPSGAFESCVASMRNTFFAIDNPVT